MDTLQYLLERQRLLQKANIYNSFYDPNDATATTNEIEKAAQFRMLPSSSVMSIKEHKYKFKKNRVSKKTGKTWEQYIYMMFLNQPNES